MFNYAHVLHPNYSKEIVKPSLSNSLFTIQLKRNIFFKCVASWFSITLTNYCLSGFHGFEGYFLDKKKCSLGLTTLKLNQLLKVHFGLNSVFCINGEPSLHLVGNFKSVKETGFTLIYKIQYECTARTRFTSASSGKKI